MVMNVSLTLTPQSTTVPQAIYVATANVASLAHPFSPRQRHYRILRSGTSFSGRGEQFRKKAHGFIAKGEKFLRVFCHLRGREF